ncbi:type II toxin-antitoxin system RelE/ParE family toxin [Candidatus Methylospira mobilis]|uniref:Type II toxin-antitoxin system RelE/ParE family toxin n=1 Tax=Candidatus Methylospira mobilis TaxID=1808979 RepID=A0A5Q0BI26_9GAMM|nr:type II toxin-antitoxin system RelE/ParE family toxin [Candidatus Methylospira mobilis]QFY42772.1 type II toxin-antitoxin system RelE/ParE family toxin [Candidatus Methylospira mobilis]
MRIFKNKAFARFAKKAGIDDPSLCKAVMDAEQGLIDANLGGGVIKQRVARSGAGKSGGFRTLILFRMKSLAFFVHGFAKNEQDNIDDDELIALKKLAAAMLGYDDAKLQLALENKTLTEVICNEKAIP